VLERAQDEIEAIVAAALAKRILIAVSYNRGRSLLAPHSLFEKHGDLHVRAVTVERDGAAPKTRKLGTFKLAGLSDVALTRRLFSRTLFEALEGEAALAGEPAAP
jgi:hypothetical protein